jgi:predicted O-methyltransferase YrrM
MEEIEKIFNSVQDKAKVFDPYSISHHLVRVGLGQIIEVCDKGENANGYYKWLHCYVDMYKPKQIVELGAASGISTIMMASTRHKPRIYSVDCDPGAWNWMHVEYKNVRKIQGDDLNLDIYPKGTHLDRTDLWFFDSLHTKRQLTAELNLYSQFFKKGAILLFDDIHINKGMEEVWNAITYKKIDVTGILHYTGFGLAMI